MRIDETSSPNSATRRSRCPSAPTPRTLLSRARRGLLGVALLGLAIGLPTSLAQDRFVDDDACPDVGTGTDLDPYCSIQTAICELDTLGGGRVLVRPGTYSEAIRIPPGVEVRSTSSAASTTIDATGQPCIDEFCQPSGPGRCAAVVFDAGTTSADVLQGFRITGGRGLVRTFGVGIDDATSGAGIFIFDGSPTITENLITDNSLTGGTSRRLGAGIYVNGTLGSAPPTPVITSNIIQNNLASNPSSGTYGPSQVAGGGIFVGPGAAPLIENNLIRNNRVDNGAIASGGGLIVYSLSSQPMTRITRNRFTNNRSAGFGGAVSFAYTLDETDRIPSVARFDNNILQLNTAVGGGGVAAGPARIELHNNTIIDNSASFGAGVALIESSNPADQAELVNNVIALNDGATVGGLSVQGATPTLRFNDFWANTPVDTNQEGVIGSNDNLAVNPRFFDVSGGGNRDLHLQLDSPLLDQGDGSVGGSVDQLGNPRIQGAGIDFGALETGDVDGDGILNHLDNCPQDANPDQADQDLDTIGDACDFDVDSDGDGVDDGVDQVPSDPLRCRDVDEDGCDDCANGFSDTFDDGTDTDADGICDVGDRDDDGDDVLDTGDLDPLDAFICGDTDLDTCDDCSVAGMSAPTNDGTDTDGDGLCDVGDFDIDGDGDGVDDLIDQQPADPLLCRDVDGDACDDCSGGMFDPAGDGPDFDGDGICDPSDDDDDNDGTDDVADCEPFEKGLSAQPSEVSTVRQFEDRIGWLRGTQGFTFNVFRGEIGETGVAAGWSLASCLFAQTPLTEVEDPEAPAPGEGFFYLVAARNACGDSGVGNTSSGNIRTLSDACESLDIDTDTDGIPDLFDNCATVADPSLVDQDGDFVGDACDNCPFTANPTQRDADLDGEGDACEVE